MKDFKGLTTNEDKLFKNIQRKNNSYENGWIGTQTMSDIAIKLGATDCFPVTLEMYGFPTIIAKDLIPFAPNGKPLRNYANSMLGSFTYPRAKTPCSILVSNGDVIWDQSCRYWAGYPEAVIYRLKDGTFGHGEFKLASELPKDVLWAVGAFGLQDMWNPSGQGFKKITVNGKTSDYYTTVAYETYHNVLGVKNGMVYGVLYESMTAPEVDDHCKNRMQFEYAIMLDGGGLGSANFSEPFGKFRTGISCGYAIQFV